MILFYLNIKVSINKIFNSEYIGLGIQNLKIEEITKE